MSSWLDCQTQRPVMQRVRALRYVGLPALTRCSTRSAGAHANEGRRLKLNVVRRNRAGQAVIRRIGSGSGGDRSLAVVASAASRLLQAYATQVETLRRLRNGGSQFVRVEHVHIAERAQAVVGLVNTRG